MMSLLQSSIHTEEIYNNNEVCMNLLVWADIRLVDGTSTIKTTNLIKLEWQRFRLWCERRLNWRLFRKFAWLNLCSFRCNAMKGRKTWRHFSCCLFVSSAQQGKHTATNKQQQHHLPAKLLSYHLYQPTNRCTPGNAHGTFSVLIKPALKSPKMKLTAGLISRHVHSDRGMQLLLYTNGLLI